MTPQAGDLEESPSSNVPWPLAFARLGVSMPVGSSAVLARA